jgi:hypothetical protein
MRSFAWIRLADIAVFISSVREVDDPNVQPPGLFSKSIIVATPGRDIQLTAPSQDRHDLWMSALQFLLQKQNATSATDNFGRDATARQTGALSSGVDEQGRLLQPKSPMSMRSFSTDRRSLNSVTPKAQRSMSSMSHRPPSTVGKRTGTAAYEYMRRHEVPATIHGGHRFKGSYKGMPVADDFDLVTRDEGDEVSEALCDVTGC